MELTILQLITSLLELVQTEDLTLTTKVAIEIGEDRPRQDHIHLDYDPVGDRVVIDTAH